MNDLIRRNDVLGACVEMAHKAHRYKVGEIWELNYKEIEEAIESIPIAEPEVGKWKPYLPEYGDMFTCSVCEEIIRLPYKPLRMPYNYCPNCGAKMEGEI